MSLGQLFNTAANLAGGSNGGSGKSLKDFLGSISKYGVQIKSNYEVQYTGFGGISFFVQSINVPGIKANTGSLHWRGRQVEIPINAEQDHNVSMTIINDGTGFIYTQMRRILEIDANNVVLSNPGAKITLKALGDGVNTGGQKIILHGPILKNVSGLDFSSTDTGISTFNTEWYVARTELKWSEMKKKEGLLGKVGKITTLA